MTLRLVKDGESVDDDAAKAATEAAEQILATVKAGGRFWLLLDGEGVSVSHVGDALEMAAVAEEVARDVKRALLGLS